MAQYNLEASEIAKLIELYSKIKTPERRIFAQGYLNGLAAAPDVPDLRNEPTTKAS